MKGLKINCPHCLENSELYLVSTPYMMVLNCPNCQSTLLHYEGQTYEIDDMKVVQMERHQIQKFVEGLKEKSRSMESVPEYSRSQTTYGAEATASSSLHRVGEAVRDRAITHDDMINLKIELESCDDVLDFIDSI